MFSYVTMEQRIPADHPIRSIRAMVDEAMRGMDAAFSAMYARRGRPSIAPERLLRAQLLMVLYSITSERRLMEQLNYNLLFRWFVGLEMDDAVWDATVFSKTRERLIEADVSQQLLLAVVEQARAARHARAARERGNVELFSASALSQGAVQKPRIELFGAPAAKSRIELFGANARGAASIKTVEEA